jgi:hypothetical protein
MKTTCTILFAGMIALIGCREYQPSGLVYQETNSESSPTVACVKGGVRIDVKVEGDALAVACPPGHVMQWTKGNNSPAVSGVQGDVTIKINPKE